VLGEVADGQAAGFLALAAQPGDFARQGLDQRTLARAVGAQDATRAPARTDSLTPSRMGAAG